MASNRTVSGVNSQDDEEDLLYFGGAIWFLFLQRQHTAERTIWTRDWLLCREDYGAYDTLLTELKQEDQKSFLNFIRMSPGLFESLLLKVTPLIERQNKSFRKAIPPGMRLAITLGYLATGVYDNIKF